MTGTASTPAIVAMMPFCSCFARRVNGFSGYTKSLPRNSLFRLASATVHGVVFALCLDTGARVPRDGMPATPQPEMRLPKSARSLFMIGERAA
ncbi:hypothetical protein [Bradyrhizobium cosmicum]|uniref:hypothetical protein n=1 Tax=Bradyrhizobium cosmicum TaxID=1404864 RepID=UPI00143DC140|nr:hypothetical protein [Bradyrhizobium cosmicum]